MAETDAKPQAQQLEKLSNMSFSIWPLTQRTRDTIIARLIENLSSPSHLSKRYRFVPLDEASEVACRFEDEAFIAIGASHGVEDDDIEFLQFYAKEISQRMLSIIKSRSTSTSATNGDNTSPCLLRSTVPLKTRNPLLRLNIESFKPLFQLHIRYIRALYQTERSSPFPR